MVATSSSVNTCTACNTACNDCTNVGANSCVTCATGFSPNSASPVVCVVDTVETAPVSESESRLTYNVIVVIALMLIALLL